MKFYIGSGFQNCEAVKAYAELLETNGWRHTYNWTKHIGGEASMDDLIVFAESERRGIEEADVVVILLPAGRGTHIELGMALALEKKVFLCAAAEEEFSIEKTVNFYQLPEIARLVGTAEENVREILRLAAPPEA